MPRIETKVIEAFTDDQVRALFKACEKERNTTLEVRDHALLSVLLDTGIRVGDGVASTCESPLSSSVQEVCGVSLA